jgi:hypothetical protein
MDQFNAIRLGTSRNLIMSAHSNSGKRWALTQDGVRYVEALLEEIEKGKK